MSMNLMAKAMAIKVGNPLRKLVLIKLADNANDKGECWPSYQHIADQCEIGRSTVKSHIRALEDMGFLKREFRRKGDLNQSNIFFLNLNNPAQGKEDDSRSAHDLGQELPEGGSGDDRGGGAGAAPRTSHSFEPVNEPNSLSGREGFVSDAAKRRIGISPAGAIPFPEKFRPSQEHTAIANERGVNIDTELLNFRDYHLARGNTMIDWGAAFKVWLRNARTNPITKLRRSEPETPHWNSQEGWEDFI